MSLYPSLEDLKVDKVIQAQTAFSANPANPAILSEASAPISQDGNLYPRLYPELSQYMGLSLNEEEVRSNVAMVSGAPIQGGIFVQLVQANSPASLVGLRFGDQVLQINGENCAGWSSDKAHKVLKQAFGEKITMTIRDRPFERTITMHKDSTGHVGFIFKNGKITSIVKDSSAARNGLLTEHNICEINGQNVIGLKDSQIADILSTSGTVVTITIMPAFIFEHIIKRMAPSIMKSLMDHTIPEV
uniref:Syndecan binding protein n=4 Tax=Platyrrhini TaxID=9479 RepID=A0A2K5S2X9_CEBIM